MGKINNKKDNSKSDIELKSSSTKTYSEAIEAHKDALGVNNNNNLLNLKKKKSIKKVNVTIYLKENINNNVDVICKETGVSKNELITNILDNYFASTTPEKVIALINEE